MYFTHPHFGVLSQVAAGKLQGTISGNPLILFGSGRHLLNLGSVVISLVLMIVFCGKDNLDGQAYLYIMLAFALFLGWHLVMSIGGADMPVVVSMLNSYSGWATAASGEYETCLINECTEATIELYRCDVQAFSWRTVC